jgi:hypothetical protein
MDRNSQRRPERPARIALAAALLGATALATLGIAVLSPVVTLFGHGEPPPTSAPLDASYLLRTLNARLALVPIIAVLALIASVGLYRGAAWARPLGIGVGMLLGLGAATAVGDLLLGFVPDEVPDPVGLILFHALYVVRGFMGTAPLVFGVQLAGLAIVLGLLGASGGAEATRGPVRRPAAPQGAVRRTAAMVALGGVGALMPPALRATEVLSFDGLPRTEVPADIAVALVGLAPLVIAALASAIGLSMGWDWAWDVAPVAIMAAWIIVVPLGLVAGLAGLVSDVDALRRGVSLTWLAVALLLLGGAPWSLRVLLGSSRPGASPGGEVSLSALA